MCYLFITILAPEQSGNVSALCSDVENCLQLGEFTVLILVVRLTFESLLILIEVVIMLMKLMLISDIIKPFSQPRVWLIYIKKQTLNF